MPKYHRKVYSTLRVNCCSHSASSTVITNILQSCLRKHSCEVEGSVVSDMVKELCEANPFTSALSSGHPLFMPLSEGLILRSSFLWCNLWSIYSAGKKTEASSTSRFWSQNQKEIQDLILHDRVDQCTGEFYYTAFSGDIHYKTNQLFRGEDHTLLLFSTLTTLR